MEEQQKNPRIGKLNLGSYGTVVGFLCMEVLAFISFYLGQSFMLYGILSIVLTILLVLVTFNQIRKEGIASFAFLLFPILVFGLLTALSKFNYVESPMRLDTVDNIFVPITLTFISAAGFFSAYIKEFKIKNALLVIYIALGAYVLINLFITMIYYVPFYTLIYKNSYIFYDGRPSVVPIDKMAYMLFGFKILEVSIEYWSLFPSLLLTACIPLFFLSPKKERRAFIIYAVLTGIAFISLLFTISKYTLLTDFALMAGIAVIVIAGKFKKSHQILNGMFIAFGALLVISLAIVFLVSQTEWGWVNGLRSMISGNAILNRLFIGNRFANGMASIFDNLFSAEKIFGFPLEYFTGRTTYHQSNIWLVDVLATSGLFGALFLLFALVFGVIKMFKYYVNSKDAHYVKLQIFGYVLGYLVMSLLLLDTTPLINFNMTIFPFYIVAPFLICLFLICYCFNKCNIDKEIAKQEEAIEVAEEEISEVEEKEENSDEVISL